MWTINDNEIMDEVTCWMILQSFEKESKCVRYDGHIYVITKGGDGGE